MSRRMLAHSLIALTLAVTGCGLMSTDTPPIPATFWSQPILLHVVRTPRLYLHQPGTAQRQLPVGVSQTGSAHPTMPGTVTTAIRTPTKADLAHLSAGNRGGAWITVILTERWRSGYTEYLFVVSRKGTILAYWRRGDANPLSWI